jgi:uncharacterized protein DUF1189
MKRYSYFHAFIFSFFSKSFYQDVARYWRGTGYLYIFIALLLLWIPSMIRMQRGFARFAEQEAPPFMKQIPHITIRKGEVSTDVTNPYFIKADDGKPLVIIDTTGQYQNLDDTEAFILLTKNKVFARDERQARIFDLSGVESFDFDRTRAESWLQNVRTWLVPVIFPLAVLFSFIFRAIQILIYAAIGLLFARMLNANLSYLTLMRLAAVALTPVLLLNLILEFVPFAVPGRWLIGILIGLGYLFFAVRSNAGSALPPGNEWTPVAPATP